MLVCFDEIPIYYAEYGRFPQNLHFGNKKIASVMKKLVKMKNVDQLDWT